MARDRFGRTTRASVRIIGTAVRPVFLKLTAPRKLAAKARTVRLTAVASVPTTLTVRIAGRRAQRFAVGRGLRRPRVGIAPGRRRLTLRLTLGTGGLTQRVDLDVARQ